ncbi:hypothetical protein H0H93_014544 [Arthromyces matolae]|nr:hypothetical protein H0H93_014544 [Arthromyces matolae]
MGIILAVFITTFLANASPIHSTSFAISHDISTPDYQSLFLRDIDLSESPSNAILVGRNPHEKPISQLLGLLKSKLSRLWSMVRVTKPKSLPELVTKEMHNLYSRMGTALQNPDNWPSKDELLVYNLQIQLLWYILPDVEKTKMQADFVALLDTYKRLDQTNAHPITDNPIKSLKVAVVQLHTAILRVYSTTVRNCVTQMGVKACVDPAIETMKSLHSEISTMSEADFREIQYALQETIQLVETTNRLVPCTDIAGNAFLELRETFRKQTNVFKPYSKREPGSGQLIAKQELRTEMENIIASAQHEAQVEIKMKPILPNEILDLFVDHLEDDKPALLVCRIVCSRWLIRARRWVSLDAVISTPGDNNGRKRGRARNPKLINSTLKLVNLLQSPHVTIHFSIRKLTIMGLDEVPCTCCELILTSGHGEATYPALNLSLETCLPYLTHVSQLRLQEFEFEFLSTKAFALLSALPQVSHLDCYGVTFPTFTDMFGLYPNLMELKVDGVLVNDIDSTVAIEPLKLLTSLSLRVTTATLEILSTTYLRPDGISSLKLTCDCDAFQYFDDIARFIATTGPGLEHFHFWVPSAFVDAPINLAHNTNLKTLTLETCDSSSVDEWAETLMNSVHHDVQVEIWVWFREEEVVDRDASYLEDFISALDRDVVLKFIASIKSKDSVSVPLAFEDAMKSKFPKQSDQGLLRFDFRPLARNEDDDDYGVGDWIACTDEEEYDNREDGDWISCADDDSDYDGDDSVVDASGVLVHDLA